MSCLNPLTVGSGTVWCRHCLPCRRVKAAGLVNRILIESLAHEAITVVCLTHATMPLGGSLDPLHLRKWMHDLRHAYTWACSRDSALGRLPPAERSRLSALRFFSNGEYSPSGRPHHHSLIYGADIRTVRNGRLFTDLVSSAWGHGMVHFGSGFTPAAASYAAGYVVKGHTKPGLDVLGDRYPEFSRSPQRPGLGVPGLAFLLRLLIGDRHAASIFEGGGDLPPTVHLAGRDRHVGQFLLDKLRAELLGSPDRVRAFHESRALAGVRGLDEVEERMLSSLVEDPLCSPALVSPAYSRRVGSAGKSYSRKRSG